MENKYLVIFPGWVKHVELVDERDAARAYMDGVSEVYKWEEGRFCGRCERCVGWSYVPVDDARESEPWMCYDGSYYDYNNSFIIDSVTYVPYIRNDGIVCPGQLDT